MKTAVVAGVLLFAALFALTTFPGAPDGGAEAKDAGFRSQEIEAWRQFGLQRSLLFWAETFVVLAFLTVLACSTRARRLADFFSRWTRERWLLTLLLMTAFCLLLRRVLTFPLDLASLELWRAWGMTERTIGNWLVDYGKAFALSAGMTAVTIVGGYVLIRWTNRWWWVWAAGCGGLLAMGVAFVLPIWVDPLFYEFQPLAEYTKLEKSDRRDLEERIRDLTERAGVQVGEVLVMNASSKGRHTNAYFTGFGATRRIVLYDTLIDSHPPGEMETIIAHEIGHWQHRHIMLGLALGTGGAFLGLYLLSRILRWAVDRPPFRLTSPSDPAGVPLVLLLVFLGTWLAAPVENAISRHFEAQADMTSLILTERPDDFVKAERRLARDNKMNVTPSPIAVWFFSSHPPTVERIQMAEQWKQRRQQR